MEKRRCVVCRKTFEPTERVPDQRFCADESCQKERRRRAQKKKRRGDADYRENDQSAQRSWRQRNPGYQSNYRRAHPDYAQRNRVQQHDRDKNRRGTADVAVAKSVLLVNEDSSKRMSPLISGTYQLKSGGAGVLVNEDPIALKMSFLSVT